MVAFAYVLSRWLVAGACLLAVVVFASAADASTRLCLEGLGSEAAQAVEESDNYREVPVCGADATSEIAQLPVVPPSRSRIDRVRGEQDSVEHAAPAAPDEPTAEPPRVPAEAIATAVELPAAPGWYVCDVSPLPRPSPAPAGVLVGVYRPPRG